MNNERSEMFKEGLLELEAGHVEERLFCIQMAIEEVCNLLQTLVEHAKENRESAKFAPAKIGADIGEGGNQDDMVAKIFGNI